MKLKLFILLITTFFVQFQLKAGQQVLDSLINLTHNQSNDSVLVELYNQIGSESNKEDEQLSQEYWGKALKIALKNVKQTSSTYFLNQLATAYNGMGIISKRRGNLPEAISYYQKSIRINEDLGMKNKLSTNYFNVGVLYRNLKEYDKALEYYEKSLKIREGLKDTNEIAKSYTAIGVLYRRMNNFDKALEYYHKSLELSKLSIDIETQAHVYSNIGVIHIEKNNFKEAEYYFKKAFEFFRTQNNQANIAKYHGNMASVYEGLGNISKAIIEAEISYHTYSEMGRVNDVASVSQKLSSLYEKNNNLKNALKFYKEYISLRDSVYNENTTKEITQKEMQFEFDKKILADSLARAEEERIQQIEYQQELNTQKMYMYGGGFILLLVLIFSSIIFNRLKITSKQKHVIEQQKLIVEEKNKEITDSITYAKRIQTAMLPSIEKIREALPASFVYYQPKDIVAGDFYWFAKKANKILIAVADCTGHGVPGAMVSVVCHNALNRAVGDFDLVNPAEILDKTAELVIEAFKKNNEDVNDGMDISLCCFDMENNKLEFSGAINSLFYIRENNLIEVKGDKQPIGQYAEIKPFTNHLIDLLPNDKFYLFSDGYPDQFGGEKGKKYMYKRFRDLILGISNDEFSKQESKLKMEFNTWKQDLDQVDDVCIIGVKV